MKICVVRHIWNGVYDVGNDVNSIRMIMLHMFSVQVEVLIIILYVALLHLRCSLLGKK